MSSRIDNPRVKIGTAFRVTKREALRFRQLYRDEHWTLKMIATHFRRSLSTINYWVTDPYNKNRLPSV